MDSILQSIVKGQDYSVKNSDIFARNLYMACLANSSLINIVFSGKNKSRLADCLEEEVKKLIWKKYPGTKMIWRKISCFPMGFTVLFMCISIIRTQIRIC